RYCRNNYPMDNRWTNGRQDQRTAYNPNTVTTNVGPARVNRNNPSPSQETNDIGTNSANALLAQIQALTTTLQATAGPPADMMEATNPSLLATHEYLVGRRKRARLDQSDQVEEETDQAIEQIAEPNPASELMKKGNDQHEIASESILGSDDDKDGSETRDENEVAEGSKSDAHEGD
ncbi:278_t:CDS:2, partial [Ambispora gerdemannii]